MGHQPRERIVVPAEFFFAGHKLMDRMMARAASWNRLPHLLARVAFLKPTVFMARPRDQMVFRRAVFENAQAKSALVRHQSGSFGGTLAFQIGSTCLAG